MTTFLIDADSYIYTSAIAAETEVEWDADEYTIWGDLDKAKSLFQDAIETLRRALTAKLKDASLVLCFTDEAPSFRKAFWPEYKGQRKRRPILYKPLRAWVFDPATGLNLYLRPGLEADDILGILGTTEAVIKGPKVLVSPDKDLLQIPGRLYNPQKDTRHFTTEPEGDRQFYTQVLTGDVTDNYPGLRGMGPKGAEKLLDKAGDNPWPAIVAAYEKAGFTEDDALIQARTARILRATEYNFKDKLPILWEPVTA